MLSWLVALGVLTIGAAALVTRRYFAEVERRRSGDSYAIVTAAESATKPYPYVYVEVDGSARELHSSERAYLEQYFLPFDSGRPYVKWRYRQKDGWGELSGDLRRSKLPRSVRVQPAPLELPNKSLTDELRERGLDVTGNDDGSLTARKSNRLFPR